MKGMKNIGWLAVCLLVMLVSGCKKAPLNDTVEQHWKLLSITTLANGKTVTCGNGLFYGITREVTMVSDKMGSKGAYVARTEYRDNESTLVLRDFKVFGVTDPAVDATVDALRPFGIINPKETIFHIAYSSHKRLVLESDYARLEFRKF